MKIYDNGRGYDSRLLGFFYSTKGEGESTGKFGEGLKMLCVASLRKGVDMTLRSQNWSSKPRALRQDVKYPFFRHSVLSRQPENLNDFDN